MVRAASLPPSHSDAARERCRILGSTIIAPPSPLRKRRELAFVGVVEGQHNLAGGDTGI